MIRKYEMMFILEALEEAKTKEEVKAILTQHGGKILTEEDYGLKTLAYPIKKRDKGFYFLVNVELEPQTLSEINSDILLNEGILKYLCILPKEKKNIEKKKVEVKEPIEEKSKSETPEKETEKEAVASTSQEKPSEA